MSTLLRFARLNWLVVSIWLAGLFLRCYRQSELLGFYYDQGRDAKISQDIISGRNYPAIGPTTGIQGLYLGPFWYYLITPGYYLGGGDPAVSAYFISFIESLTIPLIYYICNKYWNRSSAILGSLIWASSRYLISSSRWFSNPSPLPTFVLLMFIILLDAFHHRRYRHLPIVALLLSLSLQLEAASAVFIIPIVIIYGLLNFRDIKQVHIGDWFKSTTAFLLPFAPIIAFEIKNNFVITSNFFGFLTGKINTNTGSSWAIPSTYFLINRLKSYFEIFYSKVDTNTTNVSLFFLALTLAGVAIIITKHRQQKFVSLLLIWFFVPLFLLLFFVGNYGTLYDYYLTGSFPIFIILFTVSLTILLPRFNPIIISLIFGLFAYTNYIHLYNYLIAGTDGPQHITLGNQKQAVNFVCQLYQKEPHTLNIYVPPIVPHSYEYLFWWFSKQNICQQPNTDNQSKHLSFFEVDPNNPSNFNTWSQEQDRIGKIISEHRFGGITVQVRTRQKI